jgi:DNA-binding transcriptional LysR family regulator
MVCSYIMQLEALKVFCDIARYKSFSQAASANRLTQPAASRIVHQLEKRLNVKLIDRSTRPLQLTALGERYYTCCKELVETYFELERSITQNRSPLETTVEVAAIYSVGFLNMTQYTERFATLFAPAKARVEYLRPDLVYRLVREGTADLGLVSFPERARDLTILPWREEAMVLACAPSHRLAQHNPICPALLEGERYVGFSTDLAIHRKVEQFLRKQGVSVRTVQRFDNIELIKKDIEAGEGVALLPEPTLRQEVGAGTLVARPLSGCSSSEGRGRNPYPFVRPLSLIHRRSQPLSPGAQHFVKLLRESSNGTASPAKPRPGLSHAGVPPRNSPPKNGSGPPSRKN